ncbi:MAG: transposase [Ktedonobacteraceae bacterium]
MNECITNVTSHYTPAASLAALGVKLQHLRLFEPIDRLVQIAQKTVKHTPTHKLYDALISLLAGAHGMVEINTRLRADRSLQAAFGRSACAEQSVVQQTLDACTSENVTQMEEAMTQIFRQHSQAFHHDYQQDWHILDVDLSGWLCGKQAAFASKGYFALSQRNRRGRQLGRVLATRYQEVVVDRLFAGNRQLGTSVQELMQAAQVTLDLSPPQRARTLVRLDAGGGSASNLNWLLEQGYQILGKACSAQQARLLAKSVKQWVTDAQVLERQIGWVTEEAVGFVRPVRRAAVRCRKANGQWGVGVLICSLPSPAILSLAGSSVQGSDDDAALLQAVVGLYDQRGGGIETSFKGDKQGLGLTKRNKKRFEAQQVLMLLGSLAHNIVVWAHDWLTEQEEATPLQQYGILRMVRDVFHVGGLLSFDASGKVVKIMLNQDAFLAHVILPSLCRLLLPIHVDVTLGQI